MKQPALETWITDHPDYSFAHLAACDFNGVFRGKRIPLSSFLADSDYRSKMPLAVLGVDIWGCDAVKSGEVFETGDIDGYCVPTDRGFLPQIWTDQPSALLPIWMYTQDHQPYSADPRHILKGITDKFHAKGLTPVCAVELEFYLYDPGSSSSRLAVPKGVGGLGQSAAIYALSELDRFSPFIDDIYAACAVMDIPADTAIAESGCGQFEINLKHSEDPLRVADDAILLKHIVKNVAQKHGFGATFMAKPYPGDSGNGLHIHMSLTDDNGNNIFNDGTHEGSAALKSAVAGLLATLSDNALLFAPHFNSYRRLQPEMHAPIGIAWGYDNRTTAIRIPSGPAAATRIEHRVAGADANPYLVLSAVLAGALYGMENQLEPPSAVSGNAYALNLETIPTHWAMATAEFEKSSFTQKNYGALFHKMYVACKKQEQASFADRISRFEYETYLENA